MPARIRRIDPAGCGCVDCLIGYSVPIDQAPIRVFDAYARGQYADADGEREAVTDASATTEREFDRWIDQAERRS